MKRGLAIALLLALLGAGIWAALHFTTWRTEKIHTRFEPEALRNPMLAAQLLLEKNGRAASFHEGLPADTEHLDPAGTLLMLDRGHGFSPQQARRLGAFVEQGGLLILEADEASASAARQRVIQEKEEQPNAVSSFALRDPLMERLGVRVVGVKPPAPSKADPEAEDGSAGSGSGNPLLDFRASGELRLRDGEAPFLVDTDPWIRLAGRRDRAAGIQQDQAAAHFLRFELGKGRVFVFTDLDGFTNYRIVKRDHAELLWELVKDRPATGHIWLLRGDPSEGLMGWLGRHAWMALLSLGALVAVLFWKAAPRFGPLMPVPDPARRSLLEHVDASGRLLWHEGAGDRLVKVTRAALMARIESTHPAWARLPLPLLQVQLAAFSQLPDQQLLRALFEDHYATPAEFTAAIRTLEHLRKLL
ncbi:MAG: DUF4350 domain-containing protein [Holophagaceae bacterium]|nr:DUF4350 domain-containing protein [Holophagaceae bacterium]